MDEETAMCSEHPGEISTGWCYVCGKSLCPKCSVVAGGVRFCRIHAGVAEHPEPPRDAREPELSIVDTGPGPSSGQWLPRIARRRVFQGPSKRRWEVAMPLVAVGGWAGLHRFYLGRYLSGVLLALPAVVGFATGLLARSFTYDALGAQLTLSCVFMAIAIVIDRIALMLASGMFNQRLSFPRVLQNLLIAYDGEEKVPNPLWLNDLFVVSYAVFCFVAFFVVVMVSAVLRDSPHFLPGPSMSFLGISLYISLIAHGLSGLIWYREAIDVCYRTLTDIDGLHMSDDERDTPDDAKAVQEREQA